MPREYRRTLGSRSYQAYTDTKLQSALSDIRSGRMTQREAAAKYKIPRSTLKNKLKGIHSKNVGGQTMFSEEEEKMFMNHIIIMSEYGFPLDTFDLRMVVKSYADRRGMKIRQFKQNLPGLEWTRLFLKRHKSLTVRLSSNIKRRRAAVGEETINAYFDNLSKELQGVEPCHVWNYDETNLTDDPGDKKIITKRGAKYPERIINATKAAVSLMYCGNALGEVLPPYVVYKADCLWSTWMENGPPKARYNRSKSGWFDATSFEDWFKTLLLPRISKDSGKKVVIGDNLSSHINPAVLELCRANDISFIALPPNSTHLTQPLDVAYFRPMKISWRQILTEWKETEAGRKAATLPKDRFPRLLKLLTKKLEDKGSENLKAGFRKTGIVPLDRTQVLSRLPNAAACEQADLPQSDLVSQSFIDHLNKARGTDANTLSRKRKKLSVDPGKSLSAEEIQPTTTSTEVNSSQACMSQMLTISCEPADDVEEVLNEELEMDMECSSDTSTSSDTEPEPKDTPTTTSVKCISVGTYVIVKYEGSFYPGTVTDAKKKGYEVSCMAKSGTTGNWKWPSKPDVLVYSKADIAGVIKPPVKLSARGIYKVPELLVIS